MNILIVDKDSGWTIRFNTEKYPDLSTMKDRINLRLPCDLTSEALDVLMARIEQVAKKNYKVGYEHHDQFEVYAIFI